MSDVEGVDNEIGEFISQIEEGKAPNPAKLLQIERQLKSLVNNKEIPASVKVNLQQALKEISSGEDPAASDFNLSNLYNMKKEVDAALEQEKLEKKNL